MERSGYDRRKRPFVELPSEHRTNANEYFGADHRPYDYFQQQHPSKYHTKTNPPPTQGLAVNTSKVDYRKFTPPVQEYRPPRTTDTHYTSAAGSRYTPYNAPTEAPYTKVTLDDASIRSRFRRDASEPVDKRITPKVSWQYDVPLEDFPNQICEKYERPMDPKEFKEQCRKAYLQNAQDRKRNAELSVWGKCDWASYEKCPGQHRR